MAEDSCTAEQKIWQVYSFGERRVFRLQNESRECFCRRERGISFHVDGPKTEKAREPTVESLVRGLNLEAESIRSRVESTGGCVKLKTVTEIRWGSARDTFKTESVYLVLNSLLD